MGDGGKIMRLTNAHVRAAATYPDWNGGCGWTRQQLQLIGVGWPPRNGWRKEIKSGRGPLLKKRVIDKFIALAGSRRKKQVEGVPGTGQVRRGQGGNKNAELDKRAAQEHLPRLPGETMAEWLERKKSRHS